MNHLKEISKDQFKEIATEILAFIDDFCKKNDIDYYISYGTLLGAVRHGGFIPWDDDIDIVMPRSSYEKFINIFPKNNRFELVHPEKDRQYYLPFAKVFDSRTILYEDISVQYRIGVWIDIFPSEHAPLKDFTLQSRIILPFLRKALQIKLLNKEKKRSLIKRFIVKIGKFILYFFSCNDLARKINSLSRQIDKTNNISKYQNVFSSTYFSQSNLTHEKHLFPLTEIPFESIQVLGPNDPDKILSTRYGNYLELPPEDQRISNHTYNAYWK